jgi:hypothetical protein
MSIRPADCGRRRLLALAGAQGAVESEPVRVPEPDRDTTGARLAQLGLDLGFMP